MTDRKIDLDQVKARLLARRQELERLIAHDHEAGQPLNIDESSVGRLSRMDALQIQAMAQETERRHLLERTRLDAALKRLEEGEYGWCAACGGSIAPARLEADPTTPLCIKCASHRPEPHGH